MYMTGDGRTQLLTVSLVHARDSEPFPKSSKHNLGKWHLMLKYRTLLLNNLNSFLNQLGVRLQDHNVGGNLLFMHIIRHM